ncbi:MAG: TetR/AcrR family transcriptional regulator [Terracoccus sp.]
MPASADTSTSAPGLRRRRREATEADILRVARDHLAEHGAAALSLRAVARDLGMVSSGIYRYVASRDELLTRLIVESYLSLADAVTRRHDAVPTQDLEGRWDAIADAFRRWALDHPQDFTLLYGSPVPDYTAPPEQTMTAGTAVLALLLTLLEDIRAAGRLASGPPVDGPRAQEAVGHLLSDDFFAASTVDAVALTRGLAAWTLLVGVVTSEIFVQLGPLPRPDALFDVVSTAARGLVLAPSSTGSSTAGYTA